MSSSSKNDQLLPGFEDYQNKINYNNPVNIDELEDIVSYILLHTKLSKNQVEAIIREFFHIVRFLLLQGSKISLTHFGLFSPRYKGKRWGPRVHFKPAKTVIEILKKEP